MRTANNVVLLLSSAGLAICAWSLAYVLVDAARRTRARRKAEDLLP